MPPEARNTLVLNTPICYIFVYLDVPIYENFVQYHFFEINTNFNAVGIASRNICLYMKLKKVSLIFKKYFCNKYQYLLKWQQFCQKNRPKI